MDFESAITLIYCVCDDCLKAMNFTDHPQCEMSTAEIMTVGIASAYYFYGNFRTTREVLDQGNFFRRVLSESQLNKRWHAIDEQLWFVLFQLLSGINQSLHPPSHYYAVDSFPLPVCQRARSFRSKLYSGRKYLGYCKSKKLYYLGLKIHIIVSEFGFLTGFYITPASESDVRALESYEIDLPRGSVITADKAYTSYRLEDFLEKFDGITLSPLRRFNLKRQHPPIVKQVIKSTRKIVETTISCIQGLFPKAIVARTAKGFELKLVMCLLAKSCRDYITAA